MSASTRANVGGVFGWAGQKWPWLKEIFPAEWEMRTIGTLALAVVVVSLIKISRSHARRGLIISGGVMVALLLFTLMAEPGNAIDPKRTKQIEEKIQHRKDFLQQTAEQFPGALPSDPRLTDQWWGDMDSVIAETFPTKDKSMWEVFAAGVIFLYGWWLAVCLFELVFVWQHYIRRSRASRKVQDLWEPTRLEMAAAVVAAGREAAATAAAAALPPTPPPLPPPPPAAPAAVPRKIPAGFIR